MMELKTAVGCSRSAGCLEDHTQATSLDARAEAQLHQLTEAVATMQISLKDTQDQLTPGLLSSAHLKMIRHELAGDRGLR
jgi:hypothetical protein